MSEQVAPRKRPCASCPYRKNVPSGVWDAEEYDKLVRYDEETFAQPPGVFMCHQMQGDICAGWFAHSDPYELLAVRLAVSTGLIDPEVLESYSTDVPLFASGAEAAEHGKRDLECPSAEAAQTIEKVLRKQGLTLDSA